MTGNHVYYVKEDGVSTSMGVYNYTDGRGIRPVITLSRSTLLEYID